LRPSTDHPSKKDAPLTPADRRLPLLARVCALAAVVLGTLPLANWIPGGHGARWYAAVIGEWLSGATISIGLAMIGFLVVRRTGWWAPGAAARIASAAKARPALTALVLGLAAVLLYGLIARVVFAGRPLFIDEIAQVIQARIFAEGRLARPAPAYPEFFSALHLIDSNGRVFSQFPPGGPLMLLPGVLAGATWLVGPAFGALAVMLFWLLARDVEPQPEASLGAAALFTLAPFTAFMAGSHMNHVPTLAWLLLALVCLQRLQQRERPSPGLALTSGFAFGMMAAIRPVDGAAFAVPAAIWLTARVVGEPARWRDLAAAGAGVALPMLAVLFFNANTTGDPLLFGYEMLWGPSHGLGFHQAPWGVAHTPLRGLELVNLYFLRLQTYLFESPVPGLVPAAAALFLTPVLRPFDRYLLWSSVLLVAGYFAYWHDGFHLGPRFFFLLVPVLVLWTARLPGLVRERMDAVMHGDRFVLLVYGSSALVALGVSVPMRARQYTAEMASTRQDYLAPASALNVERALILVRESWGAQLMARLWALGVPRSEAETLYRGIDTCLLDITMTELERRGVRGDAALDSLTPLLRDSSRVVESTLSPDGTERMLPGARYPALCAQRIAEDRGGYTFLAPILAREAGTNVYARELHARDTLLLSAYPDRPVFLLRAISMEAGAPLGLYPASLDSARASWRAEESASRWWP
jgi:hypothetical protein